MTAFMLTYGLSSTTLAPATDLRTALTRAWQRSWEYGRDVKVYDNGVQVASVPYRLVYRRVRCE